jgi:hypothetical protein
MAQEEIARPTANHGNQGESPRANARAIRVSAKGRIPPFDGNTPETRKSWHKRITIMGQAHPYFETPKQAQKLAFEEEIAAFVIAAQQLRDRLTGHRILAPMPALPLWEPVQ